MNCRTFSQNPRTLGKSHHHHLDNKQSVNKARGRVVFRKKKKPKKPVKRFGDLAGRTVSLNSRGVVSVSYTHLTLPTRRTV